jgi:hypothetical protein
MFNTHKVGVIIAVGVIIKNVDFYFKSEQYFNVTS